MIICEIRNEQEELNGFEKVLSCCYVLVAPCFFHTPAGIGYPLHPGLGMDQYNFSSDTLYTICLIFVLLISMTNIHSKQTYLRDGRAPVPKKEAISKVMSANKGKNTKPEILFRKALWHSGIKGYRLNWKKAPGRPDIAFPAKKLAVFINGCFWHRCKKCSPNYPKSNVEFWTNKFDKNIERDRIKALQLIKLGWSVITIWECEIKENLMLGVDKLKNNLQR